MTYENLPPIESGDIWRCRDDHTLKTVVVGLDFDFNGVYLLWKNGTCPHVSLFIFYRLFERTDEHVDIPGILEKLCENSNRSLPTPVWFCDETVM